MGQNSAIVYRQSWVYFFEYLIGQIEYFVGIFEVEFRKFRKYICSKYKMQYVCFVCSYMEKEIVNESFDRRKNFF